MSSLAFILGVVPLAMATGTGARGHRPVLAVSKQGEDIVHEKFDMPLP